jgi:hypothetical protein
MFCTLAHLIPVRINDFCQAQELCRLWYPHWLSYLALPCYLTIIAQHDVSALVRAHARLYVLYFCLNPFMRAHTSSADAREYPLTLSPFMFSPFRYSSVLPPELCFTFPCQLLSSLAYRMLLSLSQFHYPFCLSFCLYLFGNSVCYPYISAP